MSKANKIVTLLLIIVASLVLVSCVKDNDFEIPSSLGEENNKKLTELLSGSATSITIAELKGLRNKPFFYEILKLHFFPLFWFELYCNLKCQNLIL